MTSSTRCPCGTGETYALCCGRLHCGDAVAATATELMRSRFSAFAVSNRDYLLSTWHSRTRPSELDLADGVRWLQLEIVQAVAGGMLDSTGEVEFRAYYRDSEKRGVLHERSSFVREEGHWFYVDGVLL